MPRDESMTIRTYVVLDPNSQQAKDYDAMIGGGVSAIVHKTPCGTMVKKFIPEWRDEPRLRSQQLRNEIAVYKLLPKNHPRLLRFCDSFDDGATNVWITLEYMPNGTLEEYLCGFTRAQSRHVRIEKHETQADRDARIRRRHDSLPLYQRARLCLEAADAVVLLHAHGVIHADIKPENMGVDAHGGVRIFDFGSSAHGDNESLGLESTRYFMPRASWDVFNANTDCFALGSSIYHIVTGYRPYDTLPDDEVEARYERNEFPDLSGQTREYEPQYAKEGDTVGISPATDQLLFADTIRKCWLGEFATSADVFAALKKETLATFDGDELATIEAQSGLALNQDGPEDGEDANSL